MKFKHVRDRLWLANRAEVEELLNVRGNQGFVLCGMNDVGMWVDLYFVKQIA